ncbi:MAG TPA: malto-oligosyltrehalose synthase [Terriglobales bacterium]|jgi:(1->4)-alpha-D-glucan 1-alpha-D-glucosylmutase|nr:malto-oligosyltrehalose synthase [Terriglobales bacterium]
MEGDTTAHGGLVSECMKAPLIPLSTYRLQFNRSFTFSQAAELVPYLAELGITHCYASPYLRSRSGSMHGYDIIDHHHLDPEIGTPEDYERFVAALHQHGMGQILDVVPNHMGIMSADNTWWLEVLENGEASTYADFFDIDWYPLKDELQGKVLVPVLGDQYGTVLDAGELKLRFDAEKGEFNIFYLKHRFPVNPREYPRILGYEIERLQQKLGAEDESLLELQSLISAFNHLPGREEAAPEKRAERLRDKEIHKRRLAALCARSPEVAEFIGQSVAKINGVAGDANSLDSLHELIKAQAYRLAYWRVAADDINYRRFFDVNDLAGLRQENKMVFLQTHEFVLQLIAEGKIDGLRVDHPDGLYDPKQYFERVQSGGDDEQGPGKSYYLVAEKILTGDERLPENWPIHGTTGYNFSNLVNGLFVDPANERKLDRIYRAFIGQHADFAEIVYQCKKLVMDRLLNSELNVLANHLSRMALADRHTCDFTLKSLRDALTEIIACFPVYRTYVTEQEVSKGDRVYINQAVDCAKEKSATAETSVYDFIRAVLLTTQGEGHPLFYRRSVVHFAMKFQQYTSALMAKGVEDTSFYRYNRLVSLNDVGGDPLRFGVTPEQFHAEIAERSRSWPDEMVATSTHDSKRSEDVRARINVLSEIPSEWHRKVRTWREMNGGKKRFHDRSEAPVANDEYLFYQTLVGAWPDGERHSSEEFVERIREYMLKAVREAKEMTSWANQNEDYEDALAEFVDGVLSSQVFCDDFAAFQKKISHFGMLNSLSQTLIKLTVPGVPDLYQGNEMWEFNLVDPDNRRAVDYERRKHVLVGSREVCGSGCDQHATFVRELTANMDDGRIKAYLVWKILNLRKQQPELFQRGEYVPLEVAGERAKHLVAFARRYKKQTLIVLAPRLCAQLLAGELRTPGGEEVWQDVQTKIPELGKGLRNLFTGEKLAAERDVLFAKHLFNNFPVALLISE